MSTSTELLDAELAELCRGDGLQDVRILTRLGPLTRKALQIRPDDDPAVQRDHLRTGLIGAARSLPRELRLVFERALGSGTGTGAPLSLAERIEQLAEELHYSSKTVRRRLAVARGGVAEHLSTRLTQVENNNPYLASDWRVREVDAEFQLSAPRPRLTERRVIESARDGLRTVTASVSLPSPAFPPAIEVFAGAGCSVGRLQRRTPSLLRCELLLPAPLDMGSRHAYEVSFVMSSRAGLRPYYVLAPFQAISRFSATVHFGSPPVASRVWRLAGVPSSILEDHPTGPADYDPQRTPTVRIGFENVAAGFCYGLRWEWADDAARSVSSTGA